MVSTKSQTTTVRIVNFQNTFAYKNTWQLTISIDTVLFAAPWSLQLSVFQILGAQWNFQKSSLQRNEFEHACSLTCKFIATHGMWLSLQEILIHMLDSICYCIRWATNGYTRVRGATGILFWNVQTLYRLGGHFSTHNMCPHPTPSKIGIWLGGGVELRNKF